MNEKGITKVNGREINLGRNREVDSTLKTLSKYRLITFSRSIRFISTECLMHFKMTYDIRNMYGLGNEKSWD